MLHPRAAGTVRFMRTLRTCGVVAAALMLALTGCGDDKKTASSSSSSSTSSSVSATSSTTGSSTTTSGGSTSSTLVLPHDAGVYAVAFIEAWSNGDRDTATRLGTTTAVDTIFAYEGGGTWDVDSCEGAAGSTYCTFNAGGDPTIVVRVNNAAAQAGAEHAVIEVQVSS
jgi:hypothetical protein